MQSISLNLLREKLKQYPHRDNLFNFIDKILENTNPVLVLLYGSLAKGTYTQKSDIDILCVYDMEFDNYNRFHYVYRYSEGIVQPTVMSVTEFNKLLYSGDSFLLSILIDGIVLYTTLNIDKINSTINEVKTQHKIEYYGY